MLYYLLPALLASAIALRSFLKDSSTSKGDLTSWIVVLLAGVLWPLALPSMALKRYHDFKQAQRSKQSLREWQTSPFI